MIQYRHRKQWIAATVAVLVLTAGKLAAQPYEAGVPVSYVRTFDALAPEQNPAVLIGRPVKDVKQTTQYFDGLGRPIQTVTKQGSQETGASPADLVSPVVYDAYGREQQKYLPFVSNYVSGSVSTTDGGLKRNPLAEQQVFMNSQYGSQGETVFYGLTEFEASPLDRVQKTMAAGNSWTGSNRGVEMKYWNNASADSVKIWKCDNVAGGFGNYSLSTYNGGMYPAGQLSKFLTIDEHGKQVIEFKDKEGKVILKKVQLTAAADNGGGSGHADWLCTYYIYDKLNNLRTVIQPEGVKKMTVDGWILTTTLLDEQCFRYEYDARNRMIRKKVPGAGEVYMVYDKLDRLVMTQDANQRMAGKWMVTKYDELSRPVETGLWTNSTPFETHLSSGYSLANYPSPASGYEVLTITHYDDYANLPGGLSSNYLSTWNSYFSATSNTAWPYPQMPQQSQATKGKVTWTQTKVLGSSTMLSTMMIYDDKGREIQVQGTNITGGTDVLTTQYSWAGQPLVSVQKQQKNSGYTEEHQVITKMEYDNLWRMSGIIKSVEGMGMMPTEHYIVKNEYDKQGQLKKKKLAPDYNGGAGLETLTYEYNIRGWMLGMNRDYARDAGSNNYFGFDLGYDKANNNLVGGQTYANPQYNGNIEGMVWKSKGDGEKRKYDFYYDAANRLLRGDFSQYTGGSFNQSAGVNYNMKMGDGLDANSAYDYNGNIRRMQQWGLKVAGSMQIDDLAYTYQINSNKLAKVTDTYTDPNTKLGDFKDGTNTGSDDYSYDINGNLLLDNNKNISNITYNHLNLPSVITVTGKGTITYTYDAAGNKLKKTVAETGKPVKTTLYMGGAVYEDDALQFAGHEEGRIRFYPALWGGMECVYDYMLKDHLGNVRMVLTEEQKTDIYPIASMEISKLSTEHQYYTIDDTKITEVTAVTGLPAYQNTNGMGNNPPDPYFEDEYSQRLYKLNSNTNKTGLGITLKVMAGDRVDIFGKSYYFENNTGGSGANSAIPVLELLTGLMGSPGGAATGGHTTATELNTIPGITGTLSSNILNDPGRDNAGYAQRPRAYINYIFFDEQFRPVANNYGFSAVSNTAGLKDHYEELQNKVAQKNGYVYIYVSNESPVNVFFDNLQVLHTRGPILEETHYYPFGLMMAGISCKATNFGEPQNKEKTFQGQRFDDELGLDWVQFKWRNHDPQIGRFIEADPLSEKYMYNSTYSFSENHITTHVELEGLEKFPINGKYPYLEKTKYQIANRRKIPASSKPIQQTTNNNDPYPGGLTGSTVTIVGAKVTNKIFSNPWLGYLTTDNAVSQTYGKQGFLNSDITLSTSSTGQPQFESAKLSVGPLSFGTDFKGISVGYQFEDGTEFHGGTTKDGLNFGTSYQDANGVSNSIDVNYWPGENTLGAAAMALAAAIAPEIGGAKAIKEALKQLTSPKTGPIPALR